MPERATKMLQEKGRIVTAFIFVVTLGLFIVGTILNNDENTTENKNFLVEFNASERKYIKENNILHIRLSNELVYLAQGTGEKFLYDYIRNIMNASGMKVEIDGTDNNEDCKIVVVTEAIRNQSNKINFTSPLFQVEGKLYIKRDVGNGEQFTGAAMASRLEESELKKIKCNNKKINWTLFETAEETVAYAIANDIDCILGDKNAIDSVLSKKDGYIGFKEKIYSRNVCIITEKQNELLASIINQCIHSKNRKLLSYRMSEKWLDGNDLLYMENDYDDVYMLVLIIFMAILIVFYIYYHSNKNLYRELSDRMNKLTASKRELKTTFGNIGYYLAELNLEGNIIDINTAFYDFIGGDSANRKIWNVLALDEHDRLALEDDIINIEKRGPLKSMEVKANNKTLVIDVYPIDNANNVLEKLLFMAADVTNERMAERQMLQDNKMIAVGQLAAGVAHEIRNPLGIIRNYCYVLKNMDDEGLREKSIEQIEKAVDTSGAIIDSLLNFSRVSSQIERFTDIEEHIKSLLLLNTSLLKKKNIRYEFVCESSVKTYITVESFDMVFVNLISNAVDAMDYEGVLTIKMKKTAEWFTVSVKDTGTGIADDELADIFNPFFTTKGDCGGTGLGLYIVYNELIKMNGSVDVESTLGEGTEFKITLPLKEGVQEEKEANDE